MTLFLGQELKVARFFFRLWARKADNPSLLACLTMSFDNIYCMFHCLLWLTDWLPIPPGVLLATYLILFCHLLRGVSKNYSKSWPRVLFWLIIPACLQHGCFFSFSPVLLRSHFWIFSRGSVSHDVTKLPVIGEVSQGDIWTFLACYWWLGSMVGRGRFISVL